MFKGRPVGAQGTLHLRSGLTALRSATLEGGKAETITQLEDRPDGLEVRGWGSGLTALSEDTGGGYLAFSLK